MSYYQYTASVRIKGDKGEIEAKENGYQYNAYSGVHGLLKTAIEQYNLIKEQHSGEVK